ncbi:MAG: hypothetical protein Q4C47_08295, partial [Planctomycetia bacterium]|nr:hypothetical protein [Planctomycetia bacterium]
ETYATTSGKSTAVLGSVPGLPLDMPLFTSEAYGKSIEGMTYEVIQGAGGSKSSGGEAGFSFRVNQTQRKVSPESQIFSRAKSLDVAVEPAGSVEVELRGGASQVTRQIWSSESPWPVYSTNGSSESRLLRVEIPPQSVQE